MSFKEFTEKSWKLPDEYYGNRYSCMVHGIGLCDEWPMIRYPTDGGQRDGSFEKNMTITVESYIGKVGGKEGVKLEQQYLVGENGLELMSHHPIRRCIIKIMNNRLEAIVDLKKYPIQDLNSPLIKEVIKKCKKDLDQFSCATIPNFILPKSLKIMNES